MASPQIENGYIRIAIELFDALCKSRISGESRQVLDAIIRKTYGYGKKEDMISTSQLMQLTGLPRYSIHRARFKLISMKLITVTKKGYSQVLNYSINKDYSSWSLLPKKVTVTKKVTYCNQKRSQTVTKKAVHNRYINNIQKIYKPLFFTFYSNYPKKQARGQAQKTWNKLLKSEILNKNTIRIIFKYLRIQNSRDTWPEYKYIPLPSSWLNNQRWHDEPKPKSKLDKWADGEL